MILDGLPEHGWKPKTYYAVDVKLTATNVEHRSILYSGFLDKRGQPGPYACIMNPTYEDFGVRFSPSYVHSICIVAELPQMSEQS